MGRPIVLAEKNRLFRALGERPEFWGALGGVILGQAVLFGGLRPFALSYLAASMLKERHMGVAAAAGILAALAAGGVNALGVCEMMLVCLLTLVFWPDKWRQTSWLAAPLVVAGADLVVKSLFWLAADAGSIPFGYRGGECSAGDHGAGHAKCPDLGQGTVVVAESDAGGKDQLVRPDAGASAGAGQLADRWTGHPERMLTGGGLGGSQYGGLRRRCSCGRGCGLGAGAG